MSKECTTHHHACDCREEKFKQLEQENAALREDAERLDWIAKNRSVSLTEKPLGVSPESLRAAIDAARKPLGDDAIMRQHLKEGGTPT